MHTIRCMHCAHSFIQTKLWLSIVYPCGIAYRLILIIIFSVFFCSNNRVFSVFLLLFMLFVHGEFITPFSFTFHSSRYSVLGEYTIWLMTLVGKCFCYWIKATITAKPNKHHHQSDQAWCIEFIGCFDNKLRTITYKSIENWLDFIDLHCVRFSASDTISMILFDRSFCSSCWLFFCDSNFVQTTNTNNLGMNWEKNAIHLYSCDGFLCRSSFFSIVRKFQSFSFFWFSLYSQSMLNGRKRKTESPLRFNDAMILLAYWA